MDLDDETPEWLERLAIAAWARASKTEKDRRAYITGFIAAYRQAFNRQIQPGDLVENLNVPDLDYRIVENVDHDEWWLTLRLPGGESAPLPLQNYRTVLPVEAP